MKQFAPPWLLWSLLVPLALTIIFLVGPVRNVLVVDGGEGAELSRALFLSHAAATDRPAPDPTWLYPMLLAAGFKIFGVSAAFARLLTLISVGALLVALGWILRDALGGPGLLIAGILLFSANGMIGLAAAARPELPAISLALVSVALCSRFSHAPTWKRLSLSGAILACSILIDPTALIIVPAFIVFVFRHLGWESTVRSFLPWSVGFLAAFAIPVVLASLNPNRWPHSLVDAAGNSRRLNELLANPGLILAAILGAICLIRKKAPAPLLFAAVWLATAMFAAGAAHFRSGPDIIHFYIPLAVLGATGFVAAARRAGRVFPGGSPGGSSLDGDKINQDRSDGLCALAAITIFALWVGFAVPDFVANLTRLDHLRLASRDELCLSIREHAAATRWCYTRYPEYAFAGGVVIPPDLAATASSPSLDAVRQYHPEQMLLDETVELQNPRWAAWTTNQYVLVDRDGDKELWISRRLQPRPIQSAHELLQRLGL